MLDISVFSEPRFRILAITKQETFVQRAITAKAERTAQHHVPKERSQIPLKIRMCRVVVLVWLAITVALKVLMLQRMNVTVDIIVRLVKKQVGQQIISARLVTTVHLEVQYNKRVSQEVIRMSTQEALVKSAPRVTIVMLLSSMLLTVSMVSSFLHLVYRDIIV